MASSQMYIGSPDRPSYGSINHNVDHGNSSNVHQNPGEDDLEKVHLISLQNPHLHSSTNGNGGNNDMDYANQEEDEEELGEGSFGSSEDLSTISSKFSTSRNQERILYSDDGIEDEDENGLYRYSHHDMGTNGVFGAYSNSRQSSPERTERAGGGGRKSFQSENNRTISLFLFAIVFVCTCAIAFLASPLSNHSSNTTSKNMRKGGSDQTNSISDMQNHLNSSMTDDDDYNSDTASSFNVVFQNTINRMPFTPISRETESEPASSIINPSLFHPSLRNSGYQNSDASQSTTLQPFLKTPFPTGAFYTNLLLTETTSDQSISYPIMVYPYAYKWSPSKLIISYPYIHRLYDAVSIRDIFQPDLTFSVVEETKSRFCTHYDALSIRLRYTTLDDEELESEELTNGSGGSAVKGVGFETYLVQGSPYVTIKYTHGTPVITALSTFSSFHCVSRKDGNAGSENSFGICSEVNSSTKSSLPSSQQDVTLEGVQFILQTQENLMWVIFASEPIELTFDALSKRTVQSTKRYDGIIRIALLPPPTSDTSSSDDAIIPMTQQVPYPSIPSVANSTSFKNLLYYSHLYPVGGTISWDFRSISMSSSSSSSSSSTSTLPSAKFPVSRNNFKFLNKNIYNSDNAQDNDQSDSGTRTYGTVKFQYTVRSMFTNTEVTDKRITTNSTNASGHGFNERSVIKDDLLMLALPHHQQVLPSNMILKDFDLSYHCIKGRMTPIIGTSWTYDELLTSIGFDDVNNTAKLLSMDASIRDTIIDQVEKDLTRVLPTLTENVYGFGKQVARLANLAKIADDFYHVLSYNNFGAYDHQNGSTYMLENDNPLVKVQSLSSQSATLLHRFLAAFFRDKNTDNLVYDANFGGIITRNGLINMQEDFGNGWYNDHHFHYGYILYASAIMGKINSTFIDEFGPHVESLLNDVANDSNQNSKVIQGSFFPFTRHKSWFDGHSYASGLFPFADGKSQESSSEAINCYYGAYLWSLVIAERGVVIKRKNNDIYIRRMNFMKLLLAMEIRSTKTYWHMVPPSSEAEDKYVDNVHPIQTYSTTFEQSLMVGNLGMMDVTVSTWFGTEKLYVHMINFMPVTAITKELFVPDYVKLEFQKVLDPIYKTVEMAWRGYVIADKAIINPSSAWEDAKGLTSYELDSALSQSQVYYWISTMDGFVAPTSSSQQQFDQYTNGNKTNIDVGGSSCSSHAACVVAGVTGECCPTTDGVMLGCCDQDSPKKEVSSNTGASDASCEQHQVCVSNELVGKCCPTEEGIMLGCCNNH